MFFPLGLQAVEGLSPEATAKIAADKAKVLALAEEPNRDKWPSELRVSGNKILNRQGREVWLQGLNVLSLDWSPLGERILQNTKVGIEDWNANLIRLAVKEHYWFGTGKGQVDGGETYRELVDAAITLAANRGAYVLLDLHRYRAPRQEHASCWICIVIALRDRSTPTFGRTPPPDTRTTPR